MLQGPRMNPRGMPNRFQGPRMMGGPGMGPRPMQSNPFGQVPMMPQGQMPRMGGRNMRSRQGGGLLSKILGRSTGQGNGPGGFLTGANTATRGAASGGGILKSLADPSALNGFLTNTQKVLGTAQQFGPMIQQYGPLVRNLPSMWKLYRGLKDLPDADEQTTEAETDQPETNKKKKKAVKAEKPAASDKPAQKKSTNGASTPKLFI
ncbi:VrrA/YqfQ family protein [Mesobacillus thioparans]|uniref:VrrA/YqfQ family protein n=1 Tax=Mesobacillus thioparans TaxID=370439 RepID=UPI0039F0ECE6